MGPGDDVLYVGFGFAEQDILWVERFAPRVGVREVQWPKFSSLVPAAALYFFP
jgi:hypothetical protein